MWKHIKKGGAPIIAPVILIILLFPALSWAGPQGVSGTTAYDIIEQARALFDESASASGKILSDSEMLDWVNWGIVDVAARSFCIQATTSITLSTGVSEYPMSGVSYLWVQSAVLNNALDISSTSSGATNVNKGLMRGNQQSIGALDANVGEPVYFVDWNETIIFYPTPDASVNNGKVTLYVYEYPTHIASADILPTPGVYDEALAMFVVSRAFRKARDLVMADYYEQKYEQEMTRRQVQFSLPLKDPEEIAK